MTELTVSLRQMQALVMLYANSFAVAAQGLDAQLYGCILIACVRLAYCCAEWHDNVHQRLTDMPLGVRPLLPCCSDMNAHTRPPSSTATPQGT